MPTPDELLQQTRTQFPGQVPDTPDITVNPVVVDTPTSWLTGIGKWIGAVGSYDVFKVVRKETAHTIITIFFVLSQCFSVWGYFGTDAQHFHEKPDIAEVVDQPEIPPSGVLGYDHRILAETTQLPAAHQQQPFLNTQVSYYPLQNQPSGTSWNQVWPNQNT